MMDDILYVAEGLKIFRNALDCMICEKRRVGHMKPHKTNKSYFIQSIFHVCCHLLVIIYLDYAILRQLIVRNFNTQHCAFSVCGKGGKEYSVGALVSGKGNEV